LPVVPDKDRQRPNHTPFVSLFTMKVPADDVGKRKFIERQQRGAFVADVVEHIGQVGQRIELFTLQLSTRM
jgi:hypothetical protein